MADKPSAPKNTGKKKSAKGKSSYAPEVMRPTAKFSLLRTGRKRLRLEEIAVLRKLSATHYPTVVNKETPSCARFEKRNQSLLCLTLMYVEVALKNWSPTYGKKKKVEEDAEPATVKKPLTEEEKQAIQAEIDRLQAKFDAQAEQRRKCMRR